MSITSALSQVADVPTVEMTSTRRRVDNVVHDVEHVLDELQLMMAEIRSVVDQIDNVSGIIEQQHDITDHVTTNDVVCDEVHRDVIELSAITEDIYDQCTIHERYATNISAECAILLSAIEKSTFARSAELHTDTAKVQHDSHRIASKSLDTAYLYEETSSPFEIVPPEVDSGYRCSSSGDSSSDCSGIDSGVHPMSASSSTLDSVSSMLSNLDTNSVGVSDGSYTNTGTRYSIEYKDMPAAIKRRCYAAGNRHSLPLPYCTMLENSARMAAANWMVDTHSEDDYDSDPSHYTRTAVKDASFNYCGVYEEEFELNVELEYDDQLDAYYGVDDGEELSYYQLECKSSWQPSPRQLSLEESTTCSDISSLAEDILSPEV